MTQVPTAARTLARHVLSHEAGGSPEPDGLVVAAERVETQLRARLAEQFGLTGYTTLFARALRLAQAEIPALRHVTVNMQEGGMSGLRDFVEAAEVGGDNPRATEDGMTAILAHLIALLSIFTRRGPGAPPGP